MFHPWIQDYVLLALRIDKVAREFANTWFVDAFYGPPELKATVEAEPESSLHDLVRAAIKLIDSLAAQGFEPQRTQYLEKQVRAMETTGRRLNDEPISLEEEIRRCLDICPEWTPEAYFEQGLALCDEALPGAGSLRDRYLAWHRRNELPREKSDLLVGIANHVLAEVRRRTRALIDLPEGEGIELRAVTEKTWGAANWYLGNYRSRLELNTDLPRNLFNLLYLMCHEGYPGHHVEFSAKEKHLFRELGYSEQAIFVVNSPQLLISEGLAEMAFEMIFTPGQAAEWAAENIYAEADIEIHDVDLPKLFRAATTSPDQIGGNAVYMLRDGCPEEEVVQYVLKYTLQTEAQARKWVDSLRSPLQHVYAFAYSHGKRLMQPLVQRNNGVGTFRRLLMEQVYPSLLVEWTKDGDAA